MDYTSAATGAPVTTPGAYLANGALGIIDQYGTVDEAFLYVEHPGDHVVVIGTDGSFFVVEDRS